MQIRFGVLAFSLLSFTPALALPSSSPSPALPSQTATVATLPPAQPSGNDTNPCDFADRSTLLNRVVSDWQGYNISLLAEICLGVCVLIYGDGNPDVSGIGVSYVLCMHLPLPFYKEHTPPTPIDFPSFWVYLVYSLLTMVFMFVVSMIGYILKLAVLTLWEWLMRNVILRLLWEKLARQTKELLAKVRNWALAALPFMLLFLPVMIWLPISVWVLGLMQGYRNDLQKALGKQYQDSYWGYGQVTIVMILLPSIYEVLRKIISRFSVLPFRWTIS